MGAKRLSFLIVNGKYGLVKVIPSQSVTDNKTVTSCFKVDFTFWFEDAYRTKTSCLKSHNVPKHLLNPMYISILLTQLHFQVPWRL
jgi:hypothetical protein